MDPNQDRKAQAAFDGYLSQKEVADLIVERERATWLKAAELAEERARDLRQHVSRLRFLDENSGLAASLEGGAVELEAMSARLRAIAEGGET